MTQPTPIRLGFLYPPTGAEHELYLAGEALDARVQVAVVGVRIAGGDEEHAPEHLRATAAIANLALSAKVIAQLAPASLMWACTSGSFIDGLAFAKEQADALARTVGAPASSTSLAFLSALEALGIDTVAVLATYPEETSRAFTAFLAEGGVTVDRLAWLDAPSGPAAAALAKERFLESGARLGVPKGGTLLLPDTAVPSLDLIAPLEARLGCPVLTANQVTVWEGARLAGVSGKGPGRLFQQSAA
jgi:maleate cis-trans isomerase